MVSEEGVLVSLLQKYNFEPTGKNIQIIQLVCLLGLVYALLTPVSWHWYFIALVAYALNVLVGLSLTMHRLYSHKCFTTSTFVQKILSVHACLSMVGSPLSYSYIHRYHHANSDTEVDPHSPKHGIIHSIFGLHQPQKVHKFIIRDFLKDEFQLFIHKKYLLVVLSVCLLVGLINFNLLIFGVLIPGFFSAMASRFNNWVTHEQKFGEQNYLTGDGSRNVWWWNVITFGSGEGWANNHHNQASHYDFGAPQHRIDTVARLVEFLAKFNIVKVRQ